MEDVLQNIDTEKRNRIINNALEEFSKNRFNKASTNTIVKNACISKGLLYHYFTSKKNLYEYLEAFSIKTMVDAILEEIDWKESDLFVRIKHVVLIKFKVFVRYPYLVAFSKAMCEKRSVDEIKKIVETYTPDIYYQIYHRNIDFSLFKENVDSEKVIKMTQWILEKLGEEWITHQEASNGDIDYKSFIEEIDVYLKMLKEAFYK